MIVEREKTPVKKDNKPKGTSQERRFQALNKPSAAEQIKNLDLLSLKR
jgi:hypothetical protein